MTQESATQSRFALLGIAGILIIIFIGVGLFELKQARVEGPKLADLLHRNAGDELRLRQLAEEEKVETAPVVAPKVAPTTSAADRRAEAQAKAQAAKDQAQAYAKAFLAKYPQARAMLIEYQTRNMEGYYSPFFRAAGMSQTQIDQFVSRTAETHLDSLLLNPNGNWNNGQPNLSADEMRSMLGDAGYQLWQDANRARPLEGYVSSIAAAVNGGATPLTPDQALQLNQIVAASSPEYVAGKRANPQTMDWDSFTTQGKAIMTDAQWQQAQVFLTMEAANRQLQALIRAQSREGQ